MHRLTADEKQHMEELLDKCVAKNPEEIRRALAANDEAILDQYYYGDDDEN